MASVEGVSIARPQIVMMNGRPVETSILREPANGAVHFGETGPDGNETAVHSEHVLISPVELLAYWHQQFCRDGPIWGPGHWGENLTVSGLPDEHHMRIGTVIAIGDTVRLEIVGPRVPCYKLMWRIGMPDNFVAEMMRDGRTGYYARVLQTGWVTAGDTVSIVSSPDHDLTAALLAQQLAPDVDGDAETLQAALALPAIGRQAAGGIRRKLSQIIDGKRCEPHRWSGWRLFRIAAKQTIAGDVTTIRFAPANGEPIAAFRGGQYVAVRLPSGLTRNWTLSDFEDHPSDYRISVKRVPGGRGSQELHGLAIGDEVWLRAPAGKFFIDPAGLDRNVLISAGIGVTPLLAMLKARLLRRAGPPTIWVHSAWNGESYAHRDEVEALLASAPEITTMTAYSRPGASDRQGADFHHAGRLTPAEIIRLTDPYMLRFAGRTTAAPGTESNFYICGPEAFETMVRETLIEAGVPENQIYSEQFGPAGNDLASDGPDEASIRFAESQVETSWTADDPVSLLDLAEQQGLRPDFDCRSGECHRCAAKLLSGEVAYPVRPLVPPRPGEVLICCARPASRHVEIAL